MNSQNQPESNSSYRLLLLAGLLAALALRLYHLGAESLWYDETVSAYLSSRQASEIIRHTAGDIHPPGYYLMLSAWRGIVSPTLNYGFEYLLGWSSVAWGMLVVVLLYPLGRKLLDRRSAVLAVWLAAVNPFHVWYSQEVRMYTMGAALGLLCLWAALTWRDSAQQSTPRRWVYLAVYVASAAIGLYTLYYFALLLVAINLIVLLLLWLDRGSADSATGRSLLAWLSAQVIALLLYAPWIPTLWRQATDPPVPPWRVPWQDAAEFFETVNESLSALLVGQAPPAGVAWPWALLTIAATTIFVIWPVSDATAKHSLPRHRRRDARITLLAYVFLPIGILYLMTLLVTPVYHVRYLFTYAPPFLLIVAASVSALWTRQRWLGFGWLVLIGGISLAALQQVWFNPSYRADEHRAAVAELAENWRPGDLILANAGWAYTALDTYWPQEVDGPHGSTSPPLTAVRRINEMPDSPVREQPIVAVTGSVDGDDSLGWGNAESDFFALSQEETTDALDQLTLDYARIWHYRIYDTVNDPQSIIRAHLAENGELLWETAYPGRDYLLVQMFANHEGASDAPEEIPAAPPVDFGEALRLTDVISSTTINAGETLYVELIWSPLLGISTLETGLNMSLRLYDSDGIMVAQADGPPHPATQVWQPGERVRQPLALPVPAAARAEPHSLELVVYRQDDGMPLFLPDDSLSVDGQRRRLGTVDVRHAQAAPRINDALARFDYIDLVEAVATPGVVAPGGNIRLDLIWRPHPNSYSDNYVATVELHNENGDVVKSWSGPLGGDNYPSGLWPPELPVLETRLLSLPSSIAPGEYMMALRVERSSDGMSIQARASRLPISSDYAAIAQVVIE